MYFQRKQKYNIKKLAHIISLYLLSIIKKELIISINKEI